ncbi:MAG TPA: ABC transporter permease [Gemmatimonadaceae bacterium]|nr:ABC transporter permease [Gemmatimonadaceae bacterium]
MASLKLALRTLRKSPFVTCIAVLSLALGIGANAAIYSMFNELLLRPLPVRDPGRLVNLSGGQTTGFNSCDEAGNCDVIFDYPMFRDLEKAHPGFTSVAAHRTFGANVAYHHQTLSGDGMLVSGSYFSTLGLNPARGRLIGLGDDRVVGQEFVAVLSYRYWQNDLGSDPNVVGQQISINGQSMTVIGVAPKGFEGTTLGIEPMVYIPISMQPIVARGVLPGWPDATRDRRTYWVYVFARLAPGVSMERAQVLANAVFHRIINDVEAPLHTEMSDAAMKRFRASALTLTDGRRGQSTMHEEVKAPLTLLLATTGIVLLIACANIANLLLARGAGRSLEMAVRLSLGATRGQLLRQLLTESCVLAVTGGAVSLLVAYWTLRLIAGILPNETASAMDFGLHGSAIVFTAALSLGTGVLFGMFPALNSTRSDLASTIRAGTGKHSGAHTAARFRSSLVTAQIALSMALLISAGLFVKSLRNVTQVHLGIRVDSMATFLVEPELNGYDHAHARQFLARLHERLVALPGVTNVTEAMIPLLANSSWGDNVSVEGFKKGPDTDVNSRLNEIGPGYFKTFGVHLLTGREFTPSDEAGAPKVAIVNQAFARKFGLGSDAVGKRMSVQSDALDIEIVGLIPDVAYRDVKADVPAVFFVPAAQDTALGYAYYYVRTSRSTEQLVGEIPKVVSSLDPNLPVEQLKTMTQQVKDNVFLDRLISTLSAAFALLATLLAAVGLYGVLAYSVAQRTREIGVRMALGADGGRVQLMVLRQVASMTLIGGLIGLVAAFALGSAAQSLLFELKGHDPAVIVCSAMALTLVAFASGYIPALRASRIDPVEALRYE